MNIFKYIVAKYFFQDYAPTVKQYKHKMRGIDGNKKPIEFSEADKAAIQKGLKQLLKDMAL